MGGLNTKPQRRDVLFSRKAQKKRKANLDKLFKDQPQFKEVACFEPGRSACSDPQDLALRDVRKAVHEPGSVCCAGPEDRQAEEEGAAVYYIVSQVGAGLSDHSEGRKEQPLRGGARSEEDHRNTLRGLAGQPAGDHDPHLRGSSRHQVRERHQELHELHLREVQKHDL